MPRILLFHRHTPDECGRAFASWRGVDSPLRHGTALGSCGSGGHCLVWEVDAEDEGQALAMLPDFVAQRTQATSVVETAIP